MPAPPLPPLAQRLTLAAWFVDQMGYEDNRAMLDDLKDSLAEWTDGRHPALIRAMEEE